MKSSNDFRKIEEAIQEKGFIGIIDEAVEELQTVSRTLSYLEGEFPALQKDILVATGHIIRAGVDLMDIKGLLKPLTD